MPGGDLARLDADHFYRAGSAWNAQVFFTQIADTYSVDDAGKLVSGQINQQSARVGHYLPILIDRLNLEGVQIVQHHKISNKAGGDCAAIIEPEILGGIIGGKADRFNRVQAKFDGAAYH